MQTEFIPPLLEEMAILQEHGNVTNTTNSSMLQTNESEDLQGKGPLKAMLKTYILNVTNNTTSSILQSNESKDLQVKGPK